MMKREDVDGSVVVGGWVVDVGEGERPEKGRKDSESERGRNDIRVVYPRVSLGYTAIHYTRIYIGIRTVQYGTAEKRKKKKGKPGKLSISFVSFHYFFSSRRYNSKILVITSTFTGKGEKRQNGIYLYSS